MLIPSARAPLNQAKIYTRNTYTYNTMKGTDDKEDEDNGGGGGGGGGGEGKGESIAAAAVVVQASVMGR